MQMQQKRHCCKRPRRSHLLNQRIRPPIASRQVQITQSTHSPAHSQSSSSDHSGNCNQRLKPLKVPVFSGEKSKFEDFWEMFLSLVDQGGGANKY